MARKNRAVYRCRNPSCGKEFAPKPSPNRFVAVKCPVCGSDDVEIVSL